MILTITNQSLLDILYQELGTDKDDLERETYRLNPHLALLPDALPAGTEVRLPEVVFERVLPVQEFWD